MASEPQYIYEYNVEGDASDMRAESSPRLLTLLPGGAAPGGPELAAGAILLGSLGLLVLLRKGVFRGAAAAGHVHIGTADVVIVGLSSVLFNATMRTIVSQPRIAETAFGRAAGWLGWA